MNQNQFQVNRNLIEKSQPPTNEENVIFFKILSNFLSIEDKRQNSKHRSNRRGNSLAVQCLGLCAFTAEGAGSIPGWGTKIPQASRCGQKEKNYIKK